MPDRPGSERDLHSLWQQRKNAYGSKHGLQMEMVDVFNGELPPEYRDYFHDEQHVHIVQMIGRAWEDLAALAGQEFPLFSQPENDTATAKSRAEKRENICYGYNAAGRARGGYDMKGLMGIYAWFMVGMAEAVACVYPDFKRQTPFFTYRDPTTHFPPIGYTPWGQGPLNDTLFVSKMKFPEIVARWPEYKDELIRKYATDPTTSEPLSSREMSNLEIDIAEFYSDDAWYVVALGAVGFSGDNRSVYLYRSESGDKDHPGVCNAVAMSLFNSRDPRSPLADQVGMQAALSRMFSQRIDYADRTIYAPLFVQGLQGNTIDIGPHAVNRLTSEDGQKPFVFQAGPTQTIDFDRMMDMLVSMQRMLNRNPESFQGAGEANSAKAVAQLRSGVTTTVQATYWPAFIQGLPQLYSKAIRMDINLWGAEKKQISGRTPDVHLRNRGLPVSTSYRPLVDLTGHEDNIEIEPGILLRGYEGRLEIMQLKGAGLMSTASALEQLDIIRDPAAEERKLQDDMLKQIQLADFGQKAQMGVLDPTLIPDIQERVNKGEDFFAVIRELGRQGRLTPPPQEAGGGIPPELAALVGGGGGGGGEPGPPPEVSSLRMLRGGG